MKIKNPLKKPDMRSPVGFFLNLIPSHTHPLYALMISYPFVLIFVIINILYFLGLFFDFETLPVPLAENAYEMVKLSKQSISSLK